MSAIVRSRVEDDLKAQSEAVFHSMGLDMSGAIKLFLRQVVIRRALPFEVRAAQPNAVTLRAIEDSYTGNGVDAFDSVDAIFEDAGR